MATDNFLRHRFVLRPGFDAEFTLPRDLTSAEALRIAAWLRTLVIDAGNEPAPRAKPENCMFNAGLAPGQRCKFCGFIQPGGATKAPRLRGGAR